MRKPFARQERSVIPVPKTTAIARAGAVLAALAVFAAIIAWIAWLAVTGRMTPS
jgi:hypothetical protein